MGNFFELFSFGINTRMNYVRYSLFGSFRSQLNVLVLLRKRFLIVLLICISSAKVGYFHPVRRHCFAWIMYAKQSSDISRDSHRRGLFREALDNTLRVFDN